MQNISWSFILKITSIICCFFLSWISKYISELYLNIDLFKLDLKKNSKNKKKMEKFVFIIKNDYAFFFITCVLQSVFSILFLEVINNIF